MEDDIGKFYTSLKGTITESVVDLSQTTYLHPWDIGDICLLLVERQLLPDKQLILPKSPDVFMHLKRMQFQQFLSELGFDKEAQALQEIQIDEQENLNLQKITHCRYVDEFSARLGHFEKMFKNFGLNEEDSKRALVIVGELGNNVFDHNIGSWPTNFNGAIIIAQNYPEMKRIEVVVSDAGVGFLGSLKNAFPDLNQDIEAIQKGLEGILEE
jgi:anti-sigma regulatory factor (Ser/Thr protein kinase)